MDLNVLELIKNFTCYIDPILTAIYDHLWNYQHDVERY